MSLVDVAALAHLVAEYDALSALRSAEAEQRLHDVCYTIAVYTGETEPARAVARARVLIGLDRGKPGPEAVTDETTAAGESGPLLTVLGELAARENGRSRPFSTLPDVLQLARTTVPDCVGAAVSAWHDDGSVDVLAASSPQLLALERAQSEAGTGPLARIRHQGSGQVVLGLDPGRPGRFADRARRCGARTVVAAHLRTHPHGCTALSVYLGSPAEPAGPTPGLVAVLALHASIALDRSALARAVADLLDRRHATGVAIGVTTERFGVTPHTALTLLARAAQRLGTDLDTVVSRVAVEGRPVPVGRENGGSPRR
ncbi:DUF5133 domain-containing protein [Kitasatospora sp. NPDC059160]|uniref:DUF5133 domain-containing protein n=1 Tax=Kitasatospora sp. NPDC059160 TaxID=3346748 RepID=UPI0036782F0F